MKFCYLFLAVGLMLSLPVEAAALDASQQERRLQQEMNVHKGSPLVSYVTRELQNYYGRSDFSDPQHTTGWYRVDDFLQWLQIKSSQLNQETIRLGSSPRPISRLLETDAFLNNPSVNAGLWVYLGARYIADVYGVSADFSKLTIIYEEKSDLAVGLGLGTIVASAKEGTSAPERINLGIHEGTHLFPFLENSNSQLTLSEMATFYSQYNYGLPVKASSAQNLGKGVRDFRRTWKYRPDWNLLYEYNYFVAGLLLNPTLKKKDIFSLRNDGQPFQAHPIWYTICNLVVAKNNRFFVKLPNGTRRTMSEHDILTYYSDDFHITPQDIALWKKYPGKDFYLGKVPANVLYPSTPSTHWFVKVSDSAVTFTEYVPQNMVQYLTTIFGSRNAHKVRKFYESILNNLPKDVVAKIEQNWNYQTLNTFDISSPAGRQVREEIVEPYQKEITRAILIALKEAGAAPVPPLPEGYL
ncbi:MAG: hypothetical protein IKN49_02485 [Elusimicrobiaceae bacterium]|nr:hypothetical protein [Elusimicrobiaceae bacterium]